LIYFFHPWFPQVFDVLCQSAVPQTWLPMSKLDHAASLFPSDAASTRKATLQHHAITRQFKNVHHVALYLRRKVASCRLPRTSYQKSSLASAPLQVNLPS
jgi:hypothetical protein